jgi:phosphoenolpyruvate synthase/pyruvate phosphate dikinase
VKVLLPIEQTAGEERALVGGKALALARLGTAGFNIPRALCVTTEAYSRFVDSGGLRGAIARELGRKRFEDMRWEEIWDAALRIPCVTGVPDAVHRIRTGDTVSVDGYVGIVTRLGHEASCDMPGAAGR